MGKKVKKMAAILNFRHFDKRYPLDNIIFRLSNLQNI